MNPFPLVCALCFASIAATETDQYPSPNSKRCEELALSADRVVIQNEEKTGAPEIVVTDRDWIVRFARALGQTRLVEVEQLFCVGADAAQFYRRGERVLSVAAIPPHHLRAYSQKGGGDFVVDERQCRIVGALIYEKMRANHAPDRMPGTTAPSDGNRH